MIVVEIRRRHARDDASCRLPNYSILKSKIKISTHVPHKWNRIDITELVLFTLAAND